MLAEVLGMMDASPTTDYLKSDIHSMTEEQAIAAFQIIKSSREGRRAIAKFIKTLTPKERRKMQSLLYGIAEQLDKVNGFLEAAFGLLHKLPF